jgi:quinol monooxygenase YgiN
VWIREVLGDVVRYESDRLRAAGLGLRTVPLAEFRRGQWALLAGDASAPLEAFWALVALHHVAIGQRWLRVDEPHGRRLVYVVADVVEVGRACAGCIVYEAGRRFDVRVVVYWHQLRNPRRFLLLANLACPRCHKQHVEPDHLAAVAHEVHQCVSDADGPGCGHQWRVHPMALGAAPPPGVAVLAAARGGA